MRKRNVLLFWNLSSAGIYDAGRDGEGTSCKGAGAGVVARGVGGEVGLDGGGGARGEEQADGGVEEGS